MRISDWSSDVCSSDLIKGGEAHAVGVVGQLLALVHHHVALFVEGDRVPAAEQHALLAADALERGGDDVRVDQVRQLAFQAHQHGLVGAVRSEEHTSELQSLMRISYAVFCLKKKNNKNYQHNAV